MAHIAPRLKARRGACEHDGNIGLFGAHDGDVARVIARRFVLFVRAVVLFVDHDEAKIGGGREHREPRAYDEPCCAGMHAMPFAIALTRREFRVQHSSRDAG